MELEDLQRVWHELGESDPLWAVITDPRFRNGGWDPEEFFALGVDQLAGILRTAGEHDLTCGRDRALDFGCGVGRLSQALAREFRSVVGLDIAPSMVEEANRRNTMGDRCRFVVNDRSDLRMFDDATFDFVVTMLVLQHMENRYARTYLAELVRVLRPGGLLVFQIPSESEDPSRPYSSLVALPDDAYRARLTAAEPGVTSTAGSRVTLTVTAHNESPHDWPRSAGGLPLALGNHWYTEEGLEIRYDDGRAFLPTVVGSGQSVTLTLVVTSPAKPGRYVLELDMVHEGVTWFVRHGSATLRLPVRVRRPRSLLPKRAVPPPADPGMEMHALPAAEVARVVEGAGGRVAYRECQPVPGFSDCTYYVTKA